MHAEEIVMVHNNKNTGVQHVNINVPSPFSGVCAAMSVSLPHEVGMRCATEKKHMQVCACVHAFQNT